MTARTAPPEARVDDFLNGHTDPTTLPQPVIDATPAGMLGYVATAYLAGVQVGRLVSRSARYVGPPDAPGGSS